MNKSILRTVKLFLGINPYEQTEFDTELLLYINSVFTKLRQMGIGPQGEDTDVKRYEIASDSETWEDIILEPCKSNRDNCERMFNEVKAYVCLSVKKLFDPPSNSSVSVAIDNELKEIEWRICETPIL
jgi:hypothetical protein